MMMSQSFNRRHSPNRRKTRVDAVMTLDSSHHPVTILDVSFKGMKLSTPLTVEVGSPIALHVMGQTIPAIVHWCRSGYIGIHLLESLEGQTLLALENAEDELAAFR
jgi:hypothetical protein